MAAPIRTVQWSTSAATLDVNLALTTALNKLRTFCANNAAKYDSFGYEFGVDLATGNFTFRAWANVFPNTYTSTAHVRQQFQDIRDAFNPNTLSL